MNKGKKYFFAELILKTILLTIVAILALIPSMAYAAAPAKPDTNPPKSTITAPVNSAFLKGVSYTIAGTASDNQSAVSKVEISINSGAWILATGTTSWSYVWALPADGAYTIRSRATDAAGNVETSSGGVTVTVDNTPPITTLQTSPLSPDGANGWFVTAPSISLTRNEAGTTYYQIDSTSSPSVYSSAFTVPSGVHTIYYYSADSAGNVETIRSQQIKVDNSNPESSVSSPADGVLLNSPSVTVSGTANDIDSQVMQVEVSIDGGAWILASGTVNWSHSASLQDGNHSVMSRATDISGRVESPKPEINFTIDATRPEVLNVSPANQETSVSVTSIVQAAFSEDMRPESITGESFILKDSQGTMIAGSISYNDAAKSVTFVPDAPLKNGEVYTATLTKDIKDLADNSLEQAYSWSFTTAVALDTLAPTTTFELSPLNPDGANGWYISSPIVTLSSNEAGVIYYQLDSTSTGSYLAYSNPLTVPAGMHVIYYYSVDSAGNTEAVQSRQIKVDTSDPVSAIVSPAEGALLNTSNVAVSGTAADSESQIAKVEVSIDGKPWVLAADTTSFSYTFSNVQEGSHEVRSRATDIAGRIENVQVARAFSIDTAKPTIPASLKAKTISSTRIDLSWDAATDTVRFAGYEVYNATNNQKIAAVAETKFTHEGLNADMTYTYYVKAVDSAGNRSNASNTASATTSKNEKTVPDGSGISVSLGAGHSLYFDNVVEPGGASSQPKSPAQKEPNSLRYVQGCYYDIHTTASFSGSVIVTVPYNEEDVRGKEEDLQLYHLNNGQWESITISVNPSNDTISGRTTSFSDFAVVESASASSTPANSSEQVAYGMNTDLALVFSLLLIGMGILFFTRKPADNTR